jgi:NAD(P)-dependent dehydrogenase (short-subunit alcohol dehydrogenase family)
MRASPMLARRRLNLVQSTWTSCPGRLGPRYECIRLWPDYTPWAEWGETSDIVEGVMYLETAHFVTGEVLHVDGGQAAGHHTLQ